MPLTITPLYAGILALLFVAMTFKVIRSRYRFRVPLGEGTSTKFRRIVRAHGNFAEYVPFTLVLMALAEIAAVPAVVLHGIGATLVAGRLLHAWSFMYSGGNLKIRVAGMWLTIFPLVAGSLLCIGVATGL